MKPLLEKEIQRAILDYLEYKKIFVWKNNTVGIKKPDGHYIPAGRRGVADILGVLPGGRFLAIEVKRQGTKATSEQNEFLLRVGLMGGLAFVARSIDDVMKQGI